MNISDYELVRSRRKTFGAEIRDGRLIVRVSLKDRQRDIDIFLEKHRDWIETRLEKARKLEEEKKSAPKLTEEEIRALAEEACRVIPGRVSYYAPLVGVTYGKITIRNQRTRWGSCSSRGNLNFNCMLMLAPPEVLDSVVVHELCHRKEMNHSGRFYAEVLRVFPEYHRWNGWLKENGAALLARAR